VSIYKRGGVYWYKFQWKGALVRKSTKQGNDKIARQMEAAHKTSLAKGEVGIREKKRIAVLGEFCRKRFGPWVESTSSHKTWRDFYRVGLRAIQAYQPLAGLTLDAITAERIADFASHRQAQGMKVSTVNASLRILRRVLRIAEEWGEVDKAPKVRVLPGELHRERVIAQEEEAKYLTSASPLLTEIATVLVDTGLRPEECYRLIWDSITWVNGRNGTLMVTHGKTKAARRALPMTQRVRHILEARWNASGRPFAGYVWPAPAPTKTGHIEPSTLKKQHSKALRLSKVRPFVLYSLRHTFLTRLGESGCDVWTLARIAGHSSIAISARYVHPSEDAFLHAMARLGRHNSGHSAKSLAQEMGSEVLLTA
jgi:integrase